MLNILVEKAAHALIKWENAASIDGVAKFYALAYDYTQQALTLAGESNKSVIFEAIASKVLKIRIEKSEV